MTETRLEFSSIGSVGKSTDPEKVTLEMYLYGSLRSGMDGRMRTRSDGSMSVWSSPSYVGSALIHVTSLRTPTSSTDLPNHCTSWSYECASDPANTGFGIDRCVWSSNRRSFRYQSTFWLPPKIALLNLSISSAMFILRCLPDSARIPLLLAGTRMMTSAGPQLRPKLVSSAVRRRSLVTEAPVSC